MASKRKGRPASLVLPLLPLSASRRHPHDLDCLGAVGTRGRENYWGLSTRARGSVLVLRIGPIGWRICGRFRLLSAARAPETPECCVLHKLNKGAVHRETGNSNF